MKQSFGVKQFGGFAKKIKNTFDAVTSMLHIQYGTKGWWKLQTYFLIKGTLVNH